MPVRAEAEDREVDPAARVEVAVERRARGVDVAVGRQPRDPVAVDRERRSTVRSIQPNSARRSPGSSPRYSSSWTIDTPPVSRSPRARRLGELAYIPTGVSPVAGTIVTGPSAWTTSATTSAPRARATRRRRRPRDGVGHRLSLRAPGSRGTGTGRTGRPSRRARSAGRRRPPSAAGSATAAALLEPEQLRPPRVGRGRLDGEPCARRPHAEAILQGAVQRRLVQVRVLDARRDRQRDPRAVDQDRHVVHRSEPFELEQRRAGRQAERLGLVERRGAHLSFEDVSARRRARARRPSPRSSSARSAARSSRRSRPASRCRCERDDAAVRELVQRAAKRHAAHAEVLRERALRRQSRPRRPAAALDLVRERLLHPLVAELQIVQGPVRRRRHAGHYRPMPHHVRPDDRPWLDVASRRS
jgi:hypothetical protein